jgi:hypothetical protein
MVIRFNIIFGLFLHELFKYNLNQLIKCKRNPAGKSRMYDPEKLATIGTQDTGRRQTM